MKILFIGGTGNISLSASKQLLEQGQELWLLNRSGTHPALPNARFLKADIHQPAEVSQALEGHHWDAVVNWIAFSPEDIERDIGLFRARTQQYIFISSASCYQNPGPSLWITEKTPLSNPFWEYSRNKIAAEQLLTKAYEEEGFPATIVRPSHTYSTVLPFAIGGGANEYTIIDRIKSGKPIVAHGDGTSLWTITHARDFAKGINGLLGLSEAIGEDFHITSDEILSWNQIYQVAAAAVGCEANIVHVPSDLICKIDPEYTGSLLGDKTECALFDNSKIKRFVPDFCATVPFAEGIKEAIDWYEEDSKRQIVDPLTNALIERLLHYTC